MYDIAGGSPHEVLDVVVAQSQRVLQTYRVDPGLIQEHANNERRIAQGGYGDRQVFELVQNAADELRDHPGGEIRVVLTGTHLYCANEGNPVSAEGAETILRMSVSKKRGGQIGRFGVGVKSILAISDAPQFFSHAGKVPFGFGFDREWSENQIRAVQPGVSDSPVLRMAQPMDPSRYRASDPLLDDLLEWATTVVRLPLKPESITRLATDLHTFPVEFPLFSPHVGTITLDDRRARSAQRQIFQRIDGARRVLQEERADGTTVEHRWNVFSRSHTPSPAALAAAGELHDRPSIDVSWAVPSRSTARGLFWAYFPTKFATTLRGVLNAPWKTSEDRQAIFDGNEFNEELLSVAADLVVDSLPSLTTSDDPAAYIDYLPGRGREAPQFADERLTRAIWKAAADRASVVDQRGVLSPPRDVRLHPEGLRDEWLAQWADSAHRPTNWVHRSVDRRERRARVVLIYHQAGVLEETVRTWLEALVATPSPEASATAIRILAAMVSDSHNLSDEALRARIVLTESGELVAPEPGRVFRRGDADSLPDDISHVDARVAGIFGIEGALDQLGVREADAAGRFAAIVDMGVEGYTPEQWTQFWELARAAGPVPALEVVRRRPGIRDKIKVRAGDGIPRPLDECLLPGPVVPDDGSRDTEIAVDVAFHRDDIETLIGLGVLSGPVSERDPRVEAWFSDYHRWSWENHINTLDQKAHRPQQGTMKVDGALPPGPLGFLRRLSQVGRAAYLQNLPRRGLVTSWTVQVGRQQTTRKAIDSPLVWMGRKEGYLETSAGLRRVHSCVSSTLAEHADVLPVAKVASEIATALRLPRSLETIGPQLWRSLLEGVSTSTEDGVAGRLYALWVDSGAEWPEGVGTRCRIGAEWSNDEPDDAIAATASRAEYDELVREAVPALLVPNEEVAATFIEHWGMRTPDQLLEKEIRCVPQAEPQLLLDLFPHLRVKKQQVEGWTLTRCSELEQITRSARGLSTRPVDSVIKDGSVLVLRPETDADALLAVDDLLQLGLGAPGVRSIIEMRRKQRESERVAAVRRATSDAEKVLRLVGEEHLRAGLPPGLEETEAVRIGGDVPAERIAELAINAHGRAVLRHHAHEIAAQNEAAPGSFTGQTAARRFVAELGLPEVYAGTSAPNPPEIEQVDGPTDFPALHRYQEQVTEAMVRLLLDPTPRRAMLRLPTGAGKTRVAVEAVIRVVRRRGASGPILWIAESEELCEQAVQSWRYVWSKVGPEGRLTISRFWSGNDAVPVRDNVHLVVATDAKLRSRLHDEDMAWLREAAMVLVDEAHRATTPTYTSIFEQLGLTFRKTERPLIGLTATPFRGVSESETKRLIDRFGGRRLDEGLFPGQDPYAALQELEVLARVEHQELPGTVLRLSQSELDAADRMNFAFLPSSAEEKLSLDSARNGMLLHEIEKLPDDWPVLVFAISVAHGKLLTALLNDRGISSTSVDSFTPMPERRAKIEDYRAGRCRVITNYGVLAQGFDAPRTRAVVIARPTYSPNVYQQMIGRGLRGPANGGAETCRILDVQDNIVNYGRSLAFTGFEHLWVGEG